ncbi:SulP family inorganic anion transporter [Solilutibacter tolerans]|uniref:Sulfate permease, SulP family n=1 Tax=Solilutibacter tolerans TaxID=1604334 RepID=A0A1N6N2Y2_9GAMM|nr:SulP family inorganic anion transporter [Lysobacter tolerans]SIP86450.1 sulfate permease, SulP family [Lysobacter tolerans]
MTGRTLPGGYRLADLKGDLSGGLVAGVIALPLALAFGVQSGLGAAAGLYGAIALGILAAALGGTRTQASGPTGPMTVVSASVVATAIATTGSLEAGLGIALLAFLCGGVLQILLGLVGVGRYVKFFPYPVVSGFMSGVGLIIIVLQLWPFLGSASPKSPSEVFTRIAEPIAAVNWSAVMLGAITVAVFYLFPRVTKAVPAVLVALLTGTLVAVAGRLDVPNVGAIPNAIPAVQVGQILSVSPEHYVLVMGFGITLALLGSIDSLLTSVIADNITKTKHDSRRELIGQGIGNSVAAVFGGIPGAGATKGTVVNINAGGTTRLSGVVHGLFLLAVLLGLGRFAAYIPLSVLAGLLIPVGLSIIDYKGLRHLARIPRADAAVLLIVMAMTVFGNLIHAVAVGVVLASILFMKKMSDLTEANSHVAELTDEPWADEEKTLGAHPGQIYIKHMYGPLFFGSASRFQDMAGAIDASAAMLVIRMEEVPYVDQSGLYALEHVALDLRRRGAELALTGVREQPLAMLRDLRIVPDLISEDLVFADMESLSAWLTRRRATTRQNERSNVAIGVT